MEIKIGIIGGTGLNDKDLISNAKPTNVETPFGLPSDSLYEGYINNVKCVLLARHGFNHDIQPHIINYRANIWALNYLGCTHIIAVTACGSLQKYIRPGDFVILDQFFDKTNSRNSTFYDNSHDCLKGIMHISMAEPFCAISRKLLFDTIDSIYPVHKTGTVITINGPRFSSRFESEQWHKMGASVINMTTVPEVILAKELGICYAAIGMVTDYDSWHNDLADPVDVASVISVMKQNSSNIKDVLSKVVKAFSHYEDWSTVFNENKKLLEMSKL